MLKNTKQYFKRISSVLDKWITLCELVTSDNIKYKTSNLKPNNKIICFILLFFIIYLLAVY